MQGICGASLYLCIEELTKQCIDASVIIVYQLLYPPSKQKCAELGSQHSVSPEAVAAIAKSLSHCRIAMQAKYVVQMEELYDDFHLVKLPLLDSEVRGVENLRRIGGYLTTPYNPE